MKRDRHILINLTEDQFNCLKFIASKENRKNSDIAYLLLINTLNNEILKYVDRGGSGFKPLKYKNEDD